MSNGIRASINKGRERKKASLGSFVRNKEKSEREIGSGLAKSVRRAQIEPRISVFCGNRGEEEEATLDL